MKVYDSTDELRDELNKIWGLGDDHVSYDTRLFSVTFYANVLGIWRRCIVGPVDGALATELLCADDHSFSVEEVRRVIVGSDFLRIPQKLFPEIHVW